MVAGRSCNKKRAFLGCAFEQPITKKHKQRKRENLLCKPESSLVPLWNRGAKFFYRAHYRSPSFDGERWIHGWEDSYSRDEAERIASKGERTLTDTHIIEETD